MRLRVAGARAFLVICASAASAQDQAVVEINAVLPSQKVRQGTGFFFREDSSILTAYHVVYGAQLLTVSVGSEARVYSDVKVEYVSGERDIAMLSVQSLKRSPSFYSIGRFAPGGSGDLEVRGYPRGSGQHSMRTYSTSKDYVRSTQLKSKGGLPIFRLPIDIITLAITNYGGMSGAPVVDVGGRVVGVFSGSYDEGGAIGWAIPTKYISEVTPLGRRAGEITQWPAQLLMAESFRELGRTSTLGGRGAELIQAYLEQVETLNKTHEGLFVAGGELAARSRLLRAVLSSKPFSQDVAAPVMEEFTKFGNEFSKLNTELARGNLSLIRSMEDVSTWFVQESTISDTAGRRLVARITT